MTCIKNVEDPARFTISLGYLARDALAEPASDDFAAYTERALHPARQPAMSAHLIDDQVLTLSGAELIEANQLMQIAINIIGRRDAFTTSLPWVNLLRRGANTTEHRMSQSRRARVTLPPPEESSVADSRERELAVIGAAEIVGVTPRHLYRLIKAREPALLLAITQENPLRLDRGAVEAYTADRHYRKAAAA